MGAILLMRTILIGIFALTLVGCAASPPRAIELSAHASEAMGKPSSTVAPSPLIPTRTVTPSRIPTLTPTRAPSPTPTYTRTPTQTAVPTATPTDTPLPTQAPSPTSTPRPPTATPWPGVPARAEALAEGVWRCPGGIEGAAYVGSAQSNKFHNPHCQWAEKIKSENRLCFASREAALAYGYVPCKVCKP